ncbi:hypothetical protein M758_5G066100 [Ceratodon purpureus]|nr:hypothetical protein M758_5G066100 [Ceratodon purpureus]
MADLPCDADGMCMVCKIVPPDSDVLLCGSCVSPWHMRCLNPPMESVPLGDWECPDCLPSIVDAKPPAVGAPQHMRICCNFVILFKLIFKLKYTIRYLNKYFDVCKSSKRAQAVFRKSGEKKGVFHKAEHAELARPMLEVGGSALLAAFEATLQKTEKNTWILLCLQSFYGGAQLTTTLGMQNLRMSFVTALIRFTSIHAPMDMQPKNVEALKALFDLCQNRIDALENTWNSVLECVSRLEYLTSTSFFTMPMGPVQLISRDALALSLLELSENQTEQVFANTVKLPGDVIVEFFSALCEASAKELNEVPPRVFSLTKLVEISYYNISRIRMVWANIWAVLSSHFVAAGSHDDEKIAMYAIDSLRQLAHKYLARSELAKFTFQNDILKPFVVLVRSSKNRAIRELIVDCMIQMIKSKVTSIKSGWKSVFMVFTSAAFDNPEMSANAFENVEQVILEHFEQVMADSFMDCVNCLMAFANYKSQSSPRTSLKAIALLRICEERLAEGHIPGGVSRVIEEGRGRDQEVAENYWFPMLSGLSELISDPRTEVRNCALDVLFDLLKEQGRYFSGPFWESVFHRILFPIFEDVRSDFYIKKMESKDQWLRETCIVSLRLICDLFNCYYKVYFGFIHVANVASIVVNTLMDVECRKYPSCYRICWVFSWIVPPSPTKH